MLPLREEAAGGFDMVSCVGPAGAASESLPCSKRSRGR